MNESDAVAFYGDPENIRVGRQVSSPPRTQMTGHVPVRFPQEIVDRVKAAAAEDGMTVSTWIRRLVTKEIEKRGTPRSAPGHFEQSWIQFHTELRSSVTVTTTTLDRTAAVSTNYGPRIPVTR